MPAPLDLTEELEEQPEPPIDGLPSKDKPISEWTSKESEAQHRSFERTMREKARREAREQREEQRRIEAGVNRTSAQRLGDAIAAAGVPEAKAAQQAAFVASLHGSDAPASLDPETPDFDGGVRETPALPSDPGADHAQLVLEYLRHLRTYGGEAW